jgi:hypothetical protein
MKDLKTILGKVKGITEDNANERFEEIANALFHNYEIKKGDKKYDFVELEFYCYSDEHKDIMTYPRDTAVGEWFIHYSGEDIAFKSKKEDKTNINPKHKDVEINVSGGGILIRIIQEKVNPDDPDNPKRTSGPDFTFCALFDHIDSSNCDRSPQIVEKEISNETILPKLRVNITADKYKKKYEVLKDYIGNLPAPIDKWAEHWADKRYRYYKIVENKEQVQ